MQEQSTRKPETPAERVIQKCGGYQTVAEWLKVDLSQVYKYTYPTAKGGTGGVIPAKHQPTLLQRARDAGKDLTPADFFDLDVANDAPAGAPSGAAA